MITAKEKEEKVTLLMPAIVFTIITVVGILVLLYFRKRIKLIAQLFKEASKALIDVPSILFEPILTFLSLLFAIVPFVFFMIVIQSAGNATDSKNLDGSVQVEFREDGGVIFARIINLIAFIWFTQFILGCQHFVIAGKIF
jgi:solute carrier family 44 protein 1 (choline transporter-like protein)